MKRRYAKLTNAQIVQISNVLASVTHYDTDDEGRCKFDDGWSDARVAQEVIPDYPGNGEDAVARLRVQLGFGRLRSGRRKDAPIKTAKIAPPIVTGLPEIIADLTRRIEALESTMGAEP